MATETRIGVGDAHETARGFVEAWHGAQQRKAAEEVLHFESLEGLLRALTPARWNLLRALRHDGPASVRALSRALHRDYKNVHTDVKLLERLGLISRDTEERVFVHWESVTAELRLAS